MLPHPMNSVYVIASIKCQISDKNSKVLPCDRKQWRKIISHKTKQKRQKKNVSVNCL